MQRILFLSFLVLFVPLASAADAQMEDEKKFEGAWQLVSIEMAGIKQDLPDAPKFVIRGGKISIDGKEKLQLKIDATTMPKILDTTNLDDSKGQVTEAIYKFDGDTLIICASPAGVKARPTEFTTKEGASHVLVVLKRLAE